MADVAISRPSVHVTPVSDPNVVAMLRAGCLGVVLSGAFVFLTPLVHQMGVPACVDLAVAAFLDRVEQFPALVSSGLLRRSGLGVFRPEGYHGPESRSTSGTLKTGFFEGWYYKLTNGNGETVVVIPGVTFGDLESFAFVMVGDASAGDASEPIRLERYPVSDLEIRGGDDWSVRVGPNAFSAGSTFVCGDHKEGIHPWRSSTEMITRPKTCAETSAETSGP